ncbi:hypothetical protein GCM10009119_02910 [Algoriphagus jejuensis]|uniref:YtxH-like protein n=1 Tax=Algoriphagus jejuensis TaxID=419934 RepID=A0ABP3Y8Z0_9BACT
MKLEYIISGIVGLTTGAFGSLLAPWVNWKIEEKKENRRNKIQLVNDLRYYLEKNDPKEERFLNSPDYIRIRPFLSDDFVNELENMEKIIVHNTFRSYYKAKFLEELETIEELWKINLPNKIKKSKSFEVKSSGMKFTVSTGRPKVEKTSEK